MLRSNQSWLGSDVLLHGSAVLIAWIGLLSGCGFVGYEALADGRSADLDGGGGDAGFSPGVDGAILSARRAFVSTPWAPGEAEGLAGADAHCNDDAAAAGVAGTYLAILANSTESPSSRFSGFAGDSWQQWDGELAVWVWDKTLDIYVEPDFVREASGAIVSNTEPVWIGTLSPSVLGSMSCSDWFDEEGGGWAAQVGEPSSTWNTAILRNCAMTARLYCVDILE